MLKIKIKYNDDEEFKSSLEGIKQFANIKKISPPIRGTRWFKVYVDIELKVS